MDWKLNSRKERGGAKAKWLSVIRRHFFCNRPHVFIGRRASPCRPRTDYGLSLVRLLILFLFFSKTPRWENCLPYNHSAGRWRPAAWFVRKAIYECDPVCARSESLWRHAFYSLCFSLSHLLTFSRVHWLTFLFLTFSFLHFSLPHWLNFSLSRFRNYQQTVGSELSVDFGTKQTLKLILRKCAIVTLP